MGSGSRRRANILASEHDAEMLAAYQLDLLSQVEAQLRAVHHTMRHIEKLRGGKAHVGPTLSNGQRGQTLEWLAAELDAMDRQLATQHECCADMQRTISQMQSRVAELKRSAANQEPPERKQQAPPKDQSLS